MVIRPLVGYRSTGARSSGDATPLRDDARMVLTAASFAVVALARAASMRASGEVSCSWLRSDVTMGEVLVSTTGLEFAYTQAPAG